MDEDFKYPILRMFFDADGVRCVFVSDVLKAYPHIDKLNINYKKNEAPRDFDTFHWDINGLIVMASADLDLFLQLYKNICLAENIKELDNSADWSLVVSCSVCNVILLPYEEAYSDHKTGQTLCTTHSKFDEGLNNYVVSI